MYIIYIYTHSEVCIYIIIYIHLTYYDIYIYIHIIEFMYIYAPLYKPSCFGWCLGASHSAGETLRTLPRRRARSGGTHCGPQGPPRGSIWGVETHHFQ